jgi:Cu(I)/Ag(I) efflux system protein CusF
MMKKFILVIFLALSFSVYAVEWTKGEIRRIDPDNKKITIRHQEIKSLDMPEMSMVFQVENIALLQGLNVNDRVEFVAEMKDKKYFVKEIRRNN